MPSETKVIPVSVVVPTRNCRGSISALLNSLRKLDYPDYEIIIVDSSDDGTDRIASKYDLKLIRTPPKGINAARNTGLSASSGDIVCFTDGDCVVPRDWISKIVAEFDKGKRIGCVGGSVINNPKSFWGRYCNETPVSVFPKYRKGHIITKNQLFAQPFLRERYPVGCNMAFKHNILLELGGFNEKWYWLGADEIELMYRLLDHDCLITVNPEIVVYHNPLFSLSRLIQRVHGYGAGAGALSEAFHVPLFRSRIRFSSQGIIYSTIHGLKTFRKTKRVSTLFYPVVDLMLGISYYLGFVNALLK